VDVFLKHGVHYKDQRGCAEREALLYGASLITPSLIPYWHPCVQTPTPDDTSGYDTHTLIHIV